MKMKIRKIISIMLPLFYVGTASSNEIVVDNSDATYTGNWTTSSYMGNSYGDDYMFVALNATTATLEWATSLQESGEYHVFYRLPDGETNRASSAQLTVNHKTGSTVYTVDQRDTDGGKWKLLGTHEFDQGTSSSVSISGSSSGIVIADAIKFVPKTIIVDNDSTEKVGAWSGSSYNPNYYGDDYLYKVGEVNGTDTVTYRPSISGTGDYEIYYWLPNGNSTRTPTADINGKHASGENSYTIDQTVANGGSWVHLGTHQLLGGTYNTISVTNAVSSAGKYVIADAFKFEQLNSPYTSFNAAQGAIVSADSTYQNYKPENAVDGVNSDASRWLSNTSNSSHWLELDLRNPYDLQCAVVANGWEDESGLSDFVLQYWSDENWVDIPGTSVNNNLKALIVLTFDEIITAQKVRLYSNSSDRVKIKELKFYTNYGECPETEPLDHDTRLYVNQSGYNLNESKRFTAPTVEDDSDFNIKKVSDDSVVYTGTINENIGDFSDFNPTSVGEEYYITSGDEKSHNFSIGYYWNERVSYQNSVDFMTSARCFFGSDPSCKTGYAWRDAHQFSFELPTLVAQYFSNPTAYERMPIKVNYQTVLNGTDYGSSEMGVPTANAPDIVKMIHWGVNRYKKLEANHPLFKEQIAYFLHAYPDLSQYISNSDYQVILSYLDESLWENTARDKKGWYEETVAPYDGNLFQTYTQIGDGKGAFPPGHSVMPNLLMYEVAKRENWGTQLENRFLDAAYNQALEIINNVDWTDPTTTKGQRMSEHVTMEGLAFYQRVYPNLAPSGLKAKIEQWADIVISRSNNLWDFRKYGDGETEWVIPGFNEPGNVVGLPAAIYSAIQVIDDQNKVERLREIAVAQLDNMFGRNPTGRHFSFKHYEWEGVEFGWYKQHDGLGKLNSATAVIDGSPKPEHYPYNPGAGDVGWTEGWVAFNSAWNSSLAYAAFDKTKIQIFDSAFTSTISSFDAGNSIGVELTAPLNFNYNIAEYGDIVITTSSGDKEVVRAYETSVNSPAFRVVVTTSADSVTVDDGNLQLASGDTLEISYGLSYLKRKVTLSGDSGTFTLDD